MRNFAHPRRLDGGHGKGGLTIVSREQKSVEPASDPDRGQSSIETRFRSDQSIRVKTRIEASKASTSMAWKWRRIELLDDTGRASHKRSSRA